MSEIRNQKDVMKKLCKMGKMYKVTKDRQGEDFMVGTIGDYDFWLNWIVEDTKNDSADEEVKIDQIKYFKSISEEELIKFIDATYEITIEEEQMEKMFLENLLNDYQNSYIRIAYMNDKIMLGSEWLQVKNLNVNEIVNVYLDDDADYYDVYVERI